MERYEEMLAPEHRSTYQAFRTMGLTEAGAYQATIGRDPAGATAGPRLDVDDLAESFERLGMTRNGAETAAAGRRFATFDEARRTEARAALRAVESAKPKPAKRAAAKPTRAKAAKTPDLAQLVENAVAKALGEQGTSTTREQLTERTRRLVEADIADIEAGRRPSDRYRDR